MSDSLRKDDTLTTADIARRPTPRQARAENMGPVPVPGRPDRIAPDSQPIQLPASGAATDQTAVQNPRPVPVARDANQPAAAATDTAPLFPDDELHNFRAQWDHIQTSFVDEPRKAVEQADGLVANVVTRIAEQFANERSTLEGQWSRGDNVNTEDLRQALRRYRSFFDRLLSF
jgi:hypothetical protein